MRESDFVDNFVNECISKGFCNTKAIVAEANKQIDEINIEILKVESYIKRMQELRVKKDNLNKVLKEHGQVVSGRKKQKSPILVMDISEISINEHGSIIKDICELFEGIEEGLMPRQISEKIGFNNGDSTSLYVTLKFLAEKGILMRGVGDKERLFINGPKFNSWKELVGEN